jgi:hypothetical protein
VALTVSQCSNCTAEQYSEHSAQVAPPSWHCFSCQHRTKQPRSCDHHESRGRLKLFALHKGTTSHHHSSSCAKVTTTQRISSCRKGPARKHLFVLHSPLPTRLTVKHQSPGSTSVGGEGRVRCLHPEAKSFMVRLLWPCQLFQQAGRGLRLIGYNPQVSIQCWTACYCTTECDAPSRIELSDSGNESSGCTAALVGWPHSCLKEARHSGCCTADTETTQLVMDITPVSMPNTSTCLPHDGSFIAAVLQVQHPTAAT